MNLNLHSSCKKNENSEFSIVEKLNVKVVWRMFQS